MCANVKLMRGIVDSLPFSLTVGTLGIVFGATAGSAGLGNLTAILMSFLVFSGSAQFAALGLWKQHATALLLTTTLLSTRFLLMSASLAARLPRIPTWLRTLLGFGATDESYALSVTRGAKGAQISVPYLAGCVLAIYVPWVLGTGLGASLIGPLIKRAQIHRRSAERRLGDE